MIEAAIYLVLTTISILYLYKILKDEIPANKKKTVIAVGSVIILSQVLNVVGHIFGIFQS
jgi:hypothetical protein